MMLGTGVGRWILECGYSRGQLKGRCGAVWRIEWTGLKMKGRQKGSLTMYSSAS